MIDDSGHLRTIEQLRVIANRYRRALIQIRHMDRVMLGEPATDADIEIEAMREFEVSLHRRMRAIAAAALDGEKAPADRHALGGRLLPAVGGGPRGGARIVAHDAKKSRQCP